MREKTYHLYLNEEERSRVIQSLIELKNNLAAQGRYTDAVDDGRHRSGHYRAALRKAPLYGGRGLHAGDCKGIRQQESIRPPRNHSHYGACKG